MNHKVPKGAYHEYCRNNDFIKSFRQTQYIRNTKTVNTQRNIINTHPIKNVDQFQNFQDYLKQFERQKPHEVKHRTSKTSREKVRSFVQTTQNSTARQNLVKPFFPFYKCRIESSYSPMKKEDFKINENKFRLNYRRIEQNMGKGQQE